MGGEEGEERCSSYYMGDSQKKTNQNYLMPHPLQNKEL